MVKINDKKNKVILRCTLIAPSSGLSPRTSNASIFSFFCALLVLPKVKF